jgi:hypothetical protein
MEQRISAALPQGSRRQDVEDWLDSQGIINAVLHHLGPRHAAPYEIDDRDITYFSGLNPDLPALDPDDVGSVVQGSMSGRKGLDRCDITLCFFFDKNERLIQVVVTAHIPSL